MAKSYTEELAEWVKNRAASRPRKDKNVVAFLAVRNDVQVAIEAGYSIKTIWEHMCEVGKISQRYETFRKHVRRYITHAPSTAKITNPEPQNTQKVQNLSSSKSDKPPKGDGFSYNPTPNKEELF